MTESKIAVITPGINIRYTLKDQHYHIEAEKKCINCTTKAHFCVLNAMAFSTQKQALLLKRLNHLLPMK